MSSILPHDHPMNKLKNCIDCGVEYPPEAFPVHKDPRGYAGYISLPRCKTCNAIWKNKSHLARKYGLSIEDYNQMLIEQGNKCSICGSSGSGEDKNKFVVDHCHHTGKVRGLLCWPCNIGLGMFRDNLDLLDKIKIYLTR